MDDISKLVLAVLSSGALGAVIAGFFQHRKLGADATEVITKAAASMVDTMQGRMDDQGGEIKELKIRLEKQGAELDRLRDQEREHQAFRRSVNYQGRQHSAWDKEIVQVVRDLDPTRVIPDPPPFTPEI